MDKYKDDNMDEKSNEMIVGEAMNSVEDMIDEAKYRASDVVEADKIARKLSNEIVGNEKKKHLDEYRANMVVRLIEEMDDEVEVCHEIFT